ncbi:MAG TPA: thioredoxin family protein [Candidatus Bilamarchaeum sp.]|nr:thioredoxin family protein [Candidatus Bilamarchaeum sp.]
MLTPSSYKVLQRGSEAPDFRLKGIDGREYSLSSFRGRKALLLIFMCNHCPYVQPKMEYFVELQAKYGPEGLQVAGINSNDTANYPEDSFAKMKEYSARYKFNFPYLIDETQETARAYGAECTPDPFLLDGSLKLAYHGRFDDAHGRPHSAGTTAEMEDAIRQLLGGREVSVQSLPSMGCNIKWKA